MPDNGDKSNVKKIMLDKVGVRRRRPDVTDPMFDDEGDSAYESQHDYEFVVNEPQPRLIIPTNRVSIIKI